jgi:hypothetical protein
MSLLMADFKPKEAEFRPTRGLDGDQIRAKLKSTSDHVVRCLYANLNMAA